MTLREKTKSWPIPIYSGLLTNGHRQKIGPAIWEFLWCIDKTTLERNNIGWVFNKKPVTFDKIAQELGESRRAAQEHIETLREHNYITTIRSSKGLTIGVLKSKKWGGEASVASDEREILKFVKGISEYPYNYQTDLEFLRTLRVDFPKIKILEELKKWKVWLMDAKARLRGKVNYRLRFRNWLQIEEQKRKLRILQEEREAESRKRLAERYDKRGREAVSPERARDLIKGVSDKLGAKKE